MTLVMSEWSDSVEFSVSDLGTSFLEMSKLLPPDSLNASGRFGRAVALDQAAQLLAVSADQDNTNGTNSGSVYLFSRAGTSWSFVTKLYGENPSANRRFGVSVALSGDGTVLAVSAYAEGAGYVYIFKKIEGAWIQTQKFTNPDLLSTAGFGYGVSLDATGQTLAVSTQGNSRYGSNAGVVYIYRDSPSGYVPGTMLHAPDAKVNGYFGTCLALSGDARFLAARHSVSSTLSEVLIYEQVQGFWLYRTKLSGARFSMGEAFISALAFDTSANYLLAGCRNDDTFATASGALLLFKRDGDQWTLQQKAKASDAEASDQFGIDVTISGDAAWAAIGAHSEDTAGIDIGAVYLLNRLGTGYVLTKETKSTGTDTDTLFFISRTGKRAVAGARLENSGRGRIYCFEKDNDGFWVQTQVINPPTAQDNSYFGYAVEFYDNDQYMIVSQVSYNGSNSNQGRLYIYALTNNTWVYTGGIVNNHAPATYRNYGTGISVSGDGQTMLLSARNQSSTTAYVFYFTRNGANWTYQGVLTRSNAANDSFGAHVSLSADGQHALIAAISNVSGFPGGKLYYFTRSGSTWTERQLLVPENVANGEGFDHFVEISADGSEAYVGTAQGTTSYVSRYSRSGTTWTFVERLEAGTHATVKFGRLTRHFDVAGEMIRGLRFSAPGHFQVLEDPEVATSIKVSSKLSYRNKLWAYDGTSTDKFGRAVSVSADGQYLAVSASFDKNVPTCGSVYVYRRSGTNWLFLYKILNDRVNGQTGLSDGSLITDLEFSPDASKLYVGMWADSEGGANRGVVAVYTANLTRDYWSFDAIITAPDAANQDYFGFAVTVSQDGNYLFVGAANSSASVTTAGKVYVFRWVTNAWVFEASVYPTDLQTGDYFGASLACNADGSYLFVAAPNEDAGGTNAGAVYYFTRAGTVWTQQGKILPDAPTLPYYYGYGLATNAAATVLLIGSRDDDTTASDAGCLVIYDKVDGNWVYRTKLYPHDADASLYFGSTASMSADGALLVVGAYGDNDRAAAGGSVYTYAIGEVAYVDEVPAVVQKQKLWPIEQAAGRFGKSVATSRDGSTLLVGRPNATVSGTATAGYVDYYTKSGNIWLYQSSFPANDVEAGANFGAALALNGDGTVALIGADQHDGSAINAGAVYYFTRSGAVWTQVQRFYSDTPAANEYFGSALALNAAGDLAAVGVSGHDGNGSNSGQVKCFTRTANTWTFEQNVVRGEWVASDYAGYDVAFNSDASLMAVGVPYAENGAIADVGAVDFFTRSGSVWTFQTRLASPLDKAQFGFGSGLALSDTGDTLVVRQLLDTAENPAGFFIYQKETGVWRCYRKVLPDDSVPMNGTEGRGLAMTADGTEIFLGLPSDNDYGTNAGSLYVFRNDRFLA